MADPTARIPRCADLPTLRCAKRVEGRPGDVCAVAATHVRPGSVWFAATHFCAAHALPCDVPIAGQQVFRRVRVSCDVLFAAVDPNQSIAQAEALLQLELAVKAAGGLLNVDRIVSNVVRWAPSGGQGRTGAVAGDPE